METRIYRRLRLNRVDFVDKGANPGAHITLAKRAPMEERRMADSKDTLPEAVAKRLADLESEKVEMAKRLKVAEDAATENAKTAKDQAEVVAKMLEDRAKDAAMLVAKGLDKIPGKIDETAHLLFIAKRKFDDTDYAAFEKVLTACNAQIKASKLFSVSGSDASGDLASDLDQLVSKRMTEKSEPQHVALSEVLKTTEGKAAWAAARGN